MSKIIEADRICGMMPTLQLAWLGEKALTHSRIAEVGCWRGRSTRVLCDNTPGLVLAVDTWMGSPGLEDEFNFLQKVTGDSDWCFKEFQRNLSGATNLEILRDTSLHAANYLKQQGRRFDMIFLDALHDYPNVLADIHAWFPLLEEGGILCGHDFTYPDVRRAVEEVFGPFPLDWRVNIWLVNKGGSPK